MESERKILGSPERKVEERERERERERQRQRQTDGQTDSIISDLSYVTDPSYV